MSSVRSGVDTRRVLKVASGWVAPLLLGVAIGLSTVEPLATVAIVGAVVGLLFLGVPRNEPVVVVAFAALCMPRLAVPGLPLPLNETLMLASVVIAALHPRGRLESAPRWLTAALWSLFTVLLFSSLANQLFTFAATKRLAHVLVFIAVAVGLTRGRIPLKSALTGLVAGLSISALSGLVGFFTGFGTSGYRGRLTGLFGDPNLAGLLLAVLGPVAIMRVETPRWRRALMAFLLVTTVLTLSRTTLLAMAVAAIWLTVGKRIRGGLALGMLILLIGSIAFLPRSIQAIGPFSDRGGSDQLRERVTTSEWESVAKSPLLGHGAGTAVVNVNADKVRFYFHDSYLALAQEGGYLALALYLSMLITTFVRLVRLSPADRNPGIEVSLIALSVCSINIGEALLELVAAVAIGVAVRHIVMVAASRSPGRVRVGVA